MAGGLSNMTDGLSQFPVRELETVQSHCQVARWPDGSMRAEIWTRIPGCDADPITWQYNLVKLPSLYG